MTESKEFDLVTASGDASLRLIAGGTVQEVNIDLIPSWDTVDERLQEAPWHFVDGNHYGTPYQWGANVLMYNTDVFGDHAARLRGALSSRRPPCPTASRQCGPGPGLRRSDLRRRRRAVPEVNQPELGIDDPYQLNEEQYQAALDLLRQQRELVGRYWHDAFVQIDDFTNEGVVASSSWPFQVNILAGGGAPIASTIPTEGATGWADTTMMHTDAPHPNCAYMWLDWSLNPKLQGDLAAWFGSVPAVPDACDGNELLGPDGCTTNGFDNFDRISFWKTPTEDCNGTRWRMCALPTLGDRLPRRHRRQVRQHCDGEGARTALPIDRLMRRIGNLLYTEKTAAVGHPPRAACARGWLVSTAGASTSLLVNSFYTIDSFSGTNRSVAHPRDLAPGLHRRQHGCGRAHHRHGVGGHDRSHSDRFPAGLPDRPLHPRKDQDGLGARGPDPAVVVVPGPGLRLETAPGERGGRQPGLSTWSVPSAVLDWILDLPVIGGPSLSTSSLGQFVVFTYIWLPYMILPIMAAVETGARIAARGFGGPRLPDRRRLSAASRGRWRSPAWRQVRSSRSR